MVGRFVATSGRKNGRQWGELIAAVGEKPIAIDRWAPFHALAERFGGAADGGVVDGGETGWIDEAPGYYAR